MSRLQEIAEDYRAVKNHVYHRYSGVRSLSKLYPGYTVQNEMTRSGLRQKLGMPSVYFYLAMYDALGDIKSQWTHTKNKVAELAGKNENLTAEEKHYIRFALNISNIFEAVLNEHPVGKLPESIQKQYDALSASVDGEKMQRYLCRQVRKYRKPLYAKTANGFSVSERAYRYGEGGIYITSKEARKRIFVPLTDTNEYSRQLYIKLHPEESRIEIIAPIDVKIREHDDYINEIAVATGVKVMMTTDEGHTYGADLGRLQQKYADWIRVQTGRYNRNRGANPGRKKYLAEKSRWEETLHSYINMELNRFFREEKPRIVYVVKLPKPHARVGSKRSNQYLAMWHRGYIRKRFLQKCMEHSVEIVEIIGKDISSVCSVCGAPGRKEKGIFLCDTCGYTDPEKVNTARNIRIRGENGQVIR